MSFKINKYEPNGKNKMGFLNSLTKPFAYIPRSNSWEETVVELADPDYVAIPLEYPRQVLYKPLVKIGEQVYKNQIIGQSELGNCVNASISGVVKDIVTIWTMRSFNVPAVLIQRNDKPAWSLDKVFGQYGVSFNAASSIDKLKAMGVISPWTLPGRFHHEADESFPEIKKVVIKGADEEPTIHIFKLLLQQNFESIIRGIKHISNLAVKAEVILTVSSNMVDWAQNIFGNLVKVVGVPNDYKHRIERMLVPRVTGIDIPNTVAYRSRGVAVISTEYLIALADALDGKGPLIHKYLTIAGSNIEKPVTIKFPIGTAVRTILESRNLSKEQYARILIGGPMKGNAQYTDLTPLTKSSHGLYLMEPEELPEETNLTCINCGRCTQVCPVNLQVQLIGRYVEFNMLTETHDFHPEACNECGLCVYVCPAHRPLVQLIQMSKKYIGKHDETNKCQIECGSKCPLERWEFNIQDSDIVAGGTTAVNSSKLLDIRG